MEVTPGCKQTEVGVIPEGWAVQAFAEVCVKIQDGTHFSPSIGGNDYLYVTSKNIGFGVLDVSDADRIDAAQHKAIYKRCDVRRGDLLLTKDGANTGNAALNTSVEEFSLLSSVAFLRFDPKRHTASYFLQQILSSPGQQRIKDAMAGNAITRLTLDKIRKLRFPVAPLPEQRVIAKALSDVDVLIGELDALIAKKRDVKQAALQQLVTGKTRIPGFSGEWVVRRLGDVTEIDPDNLASNTAPSYAFKYISLEDVDTGVLRGYSEQVFRTAPSRARRKLRQDDVLIATVRPNLQSHLLFSIAESDWVCSTGFSVVRCKTGVTHPPFLFFLLFGHCVLRQIATLLTGSNYPAINSRDVRALEIPCPSIEEQIAIAVVLSDMAAELAALEARREKTALLKQGMMQELLTGRTRLL